MAYAIFQPAQPNAIRILNRKFNEANSTEQVKKALGSGTFKAQIWNLAVQFGGRTTIHGLNRVLANKLGKYERCLWLISVIFALLSAVYVCLKLSQRYNAGNFQTVVDSTRYPVYRITFPVVTICNANRLNWQRFDEAKKRFLPNENSTEKLQLFETVVSAYDVIRFARFETFSEFRDKPLDQLNHINFSLVVDFMSWRCEELLTDCVWRHNEINCCEIFSKRRSKSGLCWSFNTLETAEGKLKKRLDDKWPWRTGSAGPKSALTVKVLVQPEKHYPKRVNEKGISVMITEPLVWHTEFFDIAMNTQTMVEIEPVIFYFDNQTRSAPSSQRECVFDDEKNSKDFKSLLGYIYMIENCQSECHQEYLVRYCNCTLDLFFPPGQYKSCRIKDLLCLADNNAYFQRSQQPGEEKYVNNEYEGMICKCFRNCFSLNYVVDIRPTYLPVTIHRNLSYVDLDVHFRFSTLMVYRTSLVFDWVDLMVAFGGIAGLFLGCSLISVIELSFFSLIEMPKFMLDKLWSKLNGRNQTRHELIKYNKENNAHLLQRPEQVDKFTLKPNLIKTISTSKNWQNYSP